MKIKDQLTQMALGLVIILCVMFTAYNFGVNSNELKIDDSNYFWVDDNCFSIYSTVTVQQNLDEYDDLFYTVIVTSKNDRQFIECFNDDIATAEEWRDSLIMALRDGIK